MSFYGRLEVVSQSDPGRLREGNEDAVGCDLHHGVVVLADGMGGYQAGEVAATMAVNIILHGIQENSADSIAQDADESKAHQRAAVLLYDAVTEANRRIFFSAQDNDALCGMGTTVVAIFFHGKRLSIAHVGDSRLYRLREHTLEQLTKDHSVLQELIDHGLFSPEQARHSPNRHLVTRALGVAETVNIELHETAVQSGDIFLLCSDGLSDMLEDRQIEQILVHHQQHMQRAAVRLIQAANEAGGHDNISVILVRADLPTPPAQDNKRWEKLLHFWPGSQNMGKK